MILGFCETDMLNDLPWVANDESEGVALSLIVEGEDKMKVLAVLQHLPFPWGRPFLKSVFADNGGGSIDTYAKTVAAVSGDRPHGYRGDADSH